MHDKMLRTLAADVRTLTSIARNPRFATVQSSDIRVFESICGQNYVKIAEIDNYATDWTKAFKGNPACVLLPSTTDEVSAILAHCAQRNIAVVPQAGNTGLVGGAVPVYDEVVVSMKRINKHIEFDEKTGTLICDAGFILEELDNHLAPHGYMMPYSLGAKGSCMIGGNVATNAGGIQLLRYGSLHAHLLGLTVVLPTDDGKVMELGSTLRKDNTSLHVPHLFLGSEGQIGLITRVVMNTVPKPSSVLSAMIGVDKFESCCCILRIARRHLSEILSSFEFLDREAMVLLEETLNLKQVLHSNPRFTILVETSGSNKEHDADKMERFLDECFNSGLTVDGVQAQSVAESSAMWRLRESAPLAVAAGGFFYKYDVSLPLNHFYELTEVIRVRCLKHTKHIVTYGHLGDGNSHLNVIAKEYTQDLHDTLHPFLYEWVAAHGGSISAEHGIGQLKLPYSTFGKSPAERDLVRRIKTVFDPKGILNPYKTF
ncbi:FAD linked oxidase protein [Dictyocaulus viviparus]|uniref:D-2-hydroxyglutarate dehydrogenase, mitochondrial n=1 Tax=Dictyocaulus viviparus TaxID=29172 RepID=A0A0D8Y5W8_DICVI|nr:FAD linked oxidase protein [Dictyocaulus viviparus]